MALTSPANLSASLRRGIKAVSSSISATVFAAAFSTGKVNHSKTVLNPSTAARIPKHHDADNPRVTNAKASTTAVNEGIAQLNFNAQVLQPTTFSCFRAINTIPANKAASATDSPDLEVACSGDNTK